MPTLAQISDIHFGRVDPPVAEALRADLLADPPTLLIVSGDLTQRGRQWQYRAARDYLLTLPMPQLVVPGNHDISLYAFWRRFLFPLSRFRRYITPDLRPFFQSTGLAVVGVNTARSLTWKSGRISREQLLDIRRRMESLSPDTFKVVVTHHPFLGAPGQKHSDVLNKGPRALATFEACGVDMVLSGHLHLSYAGDLLEQYAKSKRSILSIHAGTATSTRQRGGQPNAYNRIAIDGPTVTIEVRTYRPDQRAFLPATAKRYHRIEDRWMAK